MLSVWPTRAFFRPGEPISLAIELLPAINSPVTISLYHLNKLLTRWTEKLCSANAPHTSTLGYVTFALPSSKPCRGYLVHVQVGDHHATTAFDVLERWTQAPRYGFLYDFSSDRTAEAIQSTLDQLAALHVNGLQFYDWQYRHDTLLPPQAEYTDPLGRKLSLTTVRQLIDGGHARNMAAMPYTAIYAASPAFAEAHPDWQLYNAEQRPIDFANGFLKLMNPDSAWRMHFIHECRKMLQALPFDGVHVDQYGDPKTGFAADGTAIDLPHSFAELLTALRAGIDSDKTVLFNLVHNWPVQAMGSVPLDFWYSELWPPDITLKHLWKTVYANRQLNPRPAVLAVYVAPDWENTIDAVHSTILAAGGNHIAHGDRGRYLSDPYFPKAGLPSPALAKRLKQLADFGVAYEEAFTFAEDVTEEWLPRLALNGMQREAGQIIVHRAGKRLFVNLLNVSGRWDKPLPVPKPLADVRLNIVGGRVTRRWSASPEAPIGVPLTDERLPPIATWRLVGFELEELA